MQLKSVLVVFCALALVVAYASDEREKRAVAVIPGFGLLCITSGLCGKGYGSIRTYKPDRRYGPFYHNQYIPRRKEPKRKGPHSKKGYYFG
uniref:Uncharacterized protein n=1 Tax=Steinernema glaseri TaxID=37863 RepID=A0A1I8AT76_9BILA